MKKLSKAKRLKLFKEVTEDFKRQYSEDEELIKVFEIGEEIVDGYLYISYGAIYKHSTRGYIIDLATINAESYQDGSWTFETATYALEELAGIKKIVDYINTPAFQVLFNNK